MSVSEDEYDALPDIFDEADFAVLDAVSAAEAGSSSSTTRAAVGAIPPFQPSTGITSSSAAGSSAGGSSLASQPALPTAAGPSHAQGRAASSEASFPPSRAQHLANLIAEARSAPAWNPATFNSPSDLPVVQPIIIRRSTPPPQPTATCVESGPPHSRKRSSSAASPRKSPTKHARQASPDLREVLEQYEEELTCPICCDLLACAYIAKCGHSLCSDCAWQWIEQNKRSPTCPICRAKLSRKAPLLPNITVDSVVSRHVAALAAAGIDGWAGPAAARHIEWTSRCAKARAAATARTAAAAAAAATKAQAQPGRVSTSHVMVFEPGRGWYEPATAHNQNDDHGSDEDDEGLQGIVVHHIGQRAPRRRPVQ